MERGDRYALERRNPNRGFFFARGPVQRQLSSGQIQQEQEQEHQIGSAPHRQPVTATLEQDPLIGQKGAKRLSSPPTNPMP